MVHPNMFDPVTLNTSLVKIRPLQTVSWQKLAEGLLYENSFHSRNWGIKTSEDVRVMFERAVKALEQKRGNAIVFLNHAETEVLGMTNFMNVEPEHKMIEIGGTWIGKAHQRSSVNTETKFALLQYCFEVLKLNRVEFKIDFENIPSQKAVERLNFLYEGTLYRRKMNANNDTRDYVIYSVTDLTWPKVKAHIQFLIEQMQSPTYSVIQNIRSLRKDGKHEEAFALVASALAKHPECAELNYLAACICDASRTEREAVPFYLKSLELGLKGSDRRDALLGLGSTYRSMGDYNESKKIFQIGIFEFPGYRPYKIFLALTENNLGNSPEAIKILLEQLMETTGDREIRAYERALSFYSTRLSEVFD